MTKTTKTTATKAATKKKPTAAMSARKQLTTAKRTAATSSIAASNTKVAKVAKVAKTTKTSKSKARKSRTAPVAAPIASTASENFKSSRPSVPTKTSKPSFFRRPAAVLALVILIVAAVLIVRAVTADKNQPISQDAYQEQLQSQVETSSGTPLDGRDPANQQQNSLEDAASRPTGVGTRTSTATTDAPVASGGTSHSGDHGSDYVGTTNDPKQSGIGSNGCYIDYGIQGEQCLPAHAATNGKLTCEGVRKHFPNGIAVTGTDRFALDKNGDKIACNTGD